MALEFITNISNTVINLAITVNTKLFTNYGGQYNVYLNYE